MVEKRETELPRNLEKNAFVMPSLDKHLKIAQWFQNPADGMFYPEGSDPECGYRDVSLVVDSVSRKVALAGSRGGTLDLLDFRTGAVLNPKPIAEIKAFDEANIIVTVPGDPDPAEMDALGVNFPEIGNNFNSRIESTFVEKQLITGTLTAEVIGDLARKLAPDTRTYTQHSPAYPAGYFRLHKMPQARESGSEMDVVELPKFKMPVLDETLELAEWESNKAGRFVPKGGKYGGYPLISLYTDYDTAQTALVGFRPTKDMDKADIFIIDVQTGRALNGKPFSSIESFEENGDVIGIVNGKRVRMSGDELRDPDTPRRKYSRIRTLSIDPTGPDFTAKGFMELTKPLNPDYEKSTFAFASGYKKAFEREHGISADIRASNFALTPSDKQELENAINDEEEQRAVLLGEKIGILTALSFAIDDLPEVTTDVQRQTTMQRKTALLDYFTAVAISLGVTEDELRKELEFQTVGVPLEVLEYAKDAVESYSDELGEDPDRELVMTYLEDKMQVLGNDYEGFHTGYSEKHRVRYGFGGTIIQLPRPEYGEVDQINTTDGLKPDSVIARVLQRFVHGKPSEQAAIPVLVFGAHDDLQPVQRELTDERDYLDEHEDPDLDEPGDHGPDLGR